MTDNYSFTRVFAAACMGLFIFGIVGVTLGSSLPSLIAKFQLSEMQSGTLASLLPFGILMGSFVFGPVVDRYSYRYLLTICTLLIAAGMEGIAFAGSFPVLQLSVFLIGLGGGGMNGGTNALVADISAEKPERRSSNLSLLGIFFGIGALGMPFLMGFLSERFTYSITVGAIGAALLLAVVYFLITPFPKPKQSQRFPLKESLQLVKDNKLIFLGFFLFFQGGIEGILTNWVTLYLQTTKDFPETDALFTLSLFGLSITLTRILLVILLKRVRRYIVQSASVFLIFCGGLLLMTSTTITDDLTGVVLFGIGVSAGFPVILGYVGDLYTRLLGTAFSLVFVIALVGNILFTFLMGVVYHNFGMEKFSTMIMFCIICLSVMLILALKKISNETRI